MRVSLSGHTLRLSVLDDSRHRLFTPGFGAAQQIWDEDFWLASPSFQHPSLALPGLGKRYTECRHALATRNRLGS